MHEDCALPVVEMRKLILVACHHLYRACFLHDFVLLRLHILVLEVRPDLLKLHHCFAPAPRVIYSSCGPSLERACAG
jgi:hypothetical protein